MFYKELKFAMLVLFFGLVLLLIVFSMHGVPFQESDLFPISERINRVKFVKAISTVSSHTVVLLPTNILSIKTKN